jgi:formiminotetrahydrofolate cyclodeaminase
LEKISKRKKGNADVYKERSRNFSELVNGALEQRKEITNRLDNLIDIDKKIYEKEFDNIKSSK